MPAGKLFMAVTPTNRTKAASAPAVDRKAVEAIGNALSAHCAELARAPLPERMAQLLDRLEAADRPTQLEVRRGASG